MNIKIALGCISVSAALAFWACADGEVITADASEEVALQQVLHNRVTVEEAIASCNGNEACVAEMTDAPAADAPDSPKDEGAPDNSDNGSSLPGTNSGADNDPVVTPSSPSVTPVTPVTPTTSSASTPSTPTSSASTPKSSASTTTSSASQVKSSASSVTPAGSEFTVSTEFLAVSAGKSYTVKTGDLGYGPFDFKCKISSHQDENSLSAGTMDSKAMSFSGWQSVTNSVKLESNKSYKFDVDASVPADITCGLSY